MVASCAKKSTSAPTSQSTLAPTSKSTAATTTKQPKYGGTLIFAANAETAFIGYPPKVTRSLVTRQAAPAIETLLRSDETGQLIPWLATGFKEDSAAKTITLTLRQGVKFHDGTDFNAAAVKWNLDQQMAAKVATTSKFKSIDVIDNYTIRINLTSWDSTVTGAFAQTLGMMISPTACQKNGADWAENNPVGTGPFTFVSWKKDSRTTYKKFTDYWQKGKPYLDEIDWDIVVDSVSRDTSFRAGELDVQQMTNDPKSAAALQKAGYIIKARAPGSGVVALVPSSANTSSPWNNLKVRQAAQYAVDTQGIVDSIYYGMVEAANQFIYKGHWAYNPSVIGYPYNPSKAKQLLTEAGYPNGFKTKIIFRTGDDLQATCNTAIQGFLKSVGIDSELQMIQSGMYDQMSLQGGGWDGLINASQVGTPDLAMALAQRYSGGQYFKDMLLPDDYVKAIQDAIPAPDFATKQKLMQEVMKLMVDKYCLMIMINVPVEFIAIAPYVHNSGLLGVPYTPLWTPEDTWLDK